MSKRTLRRRLGAWTRPVRHRALFFTAEALRRLICLLPLAWIPAVGRLVGRLAWLAAFGQRRVAEKQLLQTGVARDRCEARRLGRRVLENVAMNAVEWLHSSAWPGSTFLKRVEVRGENLRAAHAEGKGVIVAMGHIGNWEIQMRACHYFLDVNLYGVMAPQRSEILNQWLVTQRERGGDKMISSQSGGLPIIRALRRGGIIGMLGDQDSSRVRGIFVDFFGRPAYTPAGIGMLSHLSGAPIVPACGWRVPGRPDRHVLIFGDPLRPDPALDPEADTLRLTKAYTAWLEARIREHPDQWVWIHRRWKRKKMMKDSAKS